jgi:hypothetical protein
MYNPGGIIIGFLVRPPVKQIQKLNHNVMKKNLFLGLAVSGLLFFSSCGPGEITVSSRPDAPYYVRPSSPGPGYVWIEGDWVARSGRYHWREGYWRRAGNRVWITGSWESGPHGWYWRRGYWR